MISGLTPAHPPKNHKETEDEDDVTCDVVLIKGVIPAKNKTYHKREDEDDATCDVVLINGVIPAQEQTKKDYKGEDEADVTCSGYDTSKEKETKSRQ